MTILDDAIADLAGSSAETSSAIRKLLVVGTRMKSQPIIDWCKKELTGYAADLYDDYPPYRQRLNTPVLVRWSGCGGSYRDLPLDTMVVPEGLRDMWKHSYAEPIDELEAFDGGKKYWPLPLVQYLRQLSDEGKAPRVDGHQIYLVWQLLTEMQIKGVVAAIRNRALMMALELQQAFPDAGEPGGPTVQDEGVGEATTNIYYTAVFGGTNSFAMGEQITQTVTHTQGDAAHFSQTLEDLGLPTESIAKLLRAVAEDGQRPGTSVQQVMQDLSTELDEGSVKDAIAGFTGHPME